ncbi:tetratricopeptide repeat protein [Paraburkholderia jirisanensis]
MSTDASLPSRTGTQSFNSMPRKPVASLSRARELHEQGRFSDAYEQYKAVLEAHPDDAQALHLYGVLQYQRGEAAEAEALLRGSVSLRRDAMAQSDLGAVLAASGRIEEALEQFHAALEIDPRHLHSLVRLGNTLLNTGLYDEALKHYDRALEVSPLSVDALCNRGSALRALGRNLDALDTYNRAVTVDARSFESFYNRGHVLRDLGRHPEALDSYDRAIAIQPGNAAMLSMRGRTLVELGRVHEALASFNEAIAIQPEFVEPLYNSAVALERLNRHQEALQRVDRVLALDPGHGPAMACRGNIHLQTEQYDAALSSYQQALDVNPRSVDVHCNRGTAFRYLGQYEHALQSYDAALAADEKFAEAWGNRANVLQDMHRYDEAMSSLDRAIALRPGHALHWFNRGNVLYEMGRPEAALQAYGQALTLDPNYRDAHFAQASMHLVQGNLEQGWAGYEWRMRDPDGELAKRTFVQPLWRGDVPLNGRTILVHAEQGFGDTLQFCRYVAMLAERGAQVTLEVQLPLKSLISTLGVPARVTVRGEPLPQTDFHCPLLSLPLALRTGLDSIPAKVPYLFADSALVDTWATLLGPKRRLRVGVAWSGNPVHRNDRQRSMSLTALLPLLACDAEWISLQKVVRGQDAQMLEGLPIRTLDTQIRDFSDTAALMQSLDLVITVDTAVAHLAGALNRPVWVLLANPPEWRWLLERHDSPWYPSARLFRQPAPGDWSAVVDLLKDEIARLAHSNHA